MRILSLLLVCGALLGLPRGASAAERAGAASRFERKGPLAAMDARERKKFQEELSTSSPFFLLGGLDLAAGIVVSTTTPYLEQGLVGVVSGGLSVIAGVSVMIGTLLRWGFGPRAKDPWASRRRVQIAVLPGVIVGRW